MNYLAILVVAILNMILGSLWYGPFFGKPWMKYMGITKSQVTNAKKKSMAGSYFTMFVSSLVMFYVLSMFITFTNSTTWTTGMITGFWVWLGFMATTMLGSILWESKPFKLYLINTLYYLVMLLIGGALLAVWV